MGMEKNSQSIFEEVFVSLIKQNQRIVREYRLSGNPWPATAREIAAWAIRSEKWRIPSSAVERKCAEEMADAMRQEYYTDSKGRRVRLLHPAKIRRQGVLFTEWDDIRTAPRKHMQNSFQQHRRKIVGECRQLKVDLDSYNDSRLDEPGLQVSFDFSMDLAELEAAQAA